MQVRNQLLVIEGFANVQTVLPSQIFGIDTDNDSEFINEVVFTYCQGLGYKQTRSRPYKKMIKHGLNKRTDQLCANW